MSDDGDGLSWVLRADMSNPFIKKSYERWYARLIEFEKYYHQNGDYYSHLRALRERKEEVRQALEGAR